MEHAADLWPDSIIRNGATRRRRCNVDADRRQDPAGADAVVNHWWQVPLYVTARGLTTSPIPDGERSSSRSSSISSTTGCCIAHERRRGGRVRAGAAAVAEFYRATDGALRGSASRSTINDDAERDAEPDPFARIATHASYDAERRSASGARWCRSTACSSGSARLSRQGSPVHFFWGSFDLAVTRFSGRRAPPHPGGVPDCPTAVTREAYSHEVSSCRLLAGQRRASAQPAFYSYAYPEPPGFATQRVPPGAAFEPRPSANSSCLTIRCAAQATPTRCCSISSRRPMPRRRIAAAGIAPRSNARWVSRAR